MDYHIEDDMHRATVRISDLKKSDAGTLKLSIKVGPLKTIGEVSIAVKGE